MPLKFSRSIRDISKQEIKNDADSQRDGGCYDADDDKRIFFPKIISNRVKYMEQFQTNIKH